MPSCNEYFLPSFDEFRTNIQTTLSQIDNTLQILKMKDVKENSQVTTYLNLFEALYIILSAEKNFRSEDFSNASLTYAESIQILDKIKHSNHILSLEHLQTAERLELFAKGRQFECHALKKGIAITDKISYLNEAKKTYSLEAQLAEKIGKPILKYNANARANFVQGLLFKTEGQNALENKDLYLAKKRHLEAYRFFSIATYFNSTYSTWVSEQNDILKKIMNTIVRNRAALEWKEAYKLSNEGKFLESSEKCIAASKLYKRASKISSDEEDSMMLAAYSFMLQASMSEAKANDRFKKNNDAKGAIPHFELAAEAMEQALKALPKEEKDQKLQLRWQAQWKYYLGCFHQTQGISYLDIEKYDQALKLFQEGENEFQSALQDAETAKENNLVILLKKSIAEAKGYIGMCKTVLD